MSSFFVGGALGAASRGQFPQWSRVKTPGKVDKRQVLGILGWEIDRRSSLPRTSVRNVFFAHKLSDVLRCLWAPLRAKDGELIRDFMIRARMKKTLPHENLFFARPRHFPLIDSSAIRKFDAFDKLLEAIMSSRLMDCQRNEIEFSSGKLCHKCFTWSWFDN